MTTYRRTALRQDGDPEGPLRFVIATEGRKGDGIDLKMGNLDLERYTGNPVVMAMHDYWTLPVGRGENVEVDGPNLLADAVFDLDDPVGANLDRKYRGGFMNAVSVGFNVYDVDDQGVPARWELLEFSAVPIPMDASALLDSGRQARALVEALDAVRAGKVLSKGNKTLVEQAVTALAALLDAAGEPGKDDGQDDDDDRAVIPAPTRDKHRALLDQCAALA